MFSFYLIFFRQKVVALKEELEKEEFYVEYLEHLLADVEKQKTRAAGDGEAASEDKTNSIDKSDIEELVESSNKFSKSCSQNSIDLCISELADKTPIKEKNVPFHPSGTDRSISVEETNLKYEESEKKTLEARQRSLTQPNLLNFITVIEINGKKKVELPLKCPPKPPPKTFMRANPDGKTKTTEVLALENESLKKRIGPSLPSPNASLEDNETSENKSVATGEETIEVEPSYGKIKKMPPYKTEDSVLPSNGLNK